MLRPLGKMAPSAKLATNDFFTARTYNLAPPPRKLARRSGQTILAAANFPEGGFK